MDNGQQPPTMEQQLESVTRAFRWWLAGIGYSAFCLLTIRFPRALNSVYFLAFLNVRGAFVFAAACAMFARDARKKQHFLRPFVEESRQSSLERQLVAFAERNAAKQPPQGS
jgi:hypothetical protein